jgi:hypothetical protein
MTVEKDAEAPVETNDTADGAVLQELVSREAARKGQTAPRLPRAVANLTPQQLKEKVESVGRTAAVLVAAWFCYSIGGGVASFAMQRYVVRARSGLTGDDLWMAQLLLAAPFIVFALVGGVLLKTKSGLRRPEKWCLALGAMFALSRLRNFQWCGPADSSVAMIARWVDAATVFAGTFIGLSLGTSKPQTQADRFGPDPIEP